MLKPHISLIEEKKIVLQQKLTFIGITLIFVISQAIFFQHFNGSDDLHYAWLGAMVKQGTYTPLRIDDIFCGRILLALSQGLIYKIGGISVFTTQLGTYLATIGGCYLTIFKMLKPTNARMVVIAAALFYFNFVLLNIALGPSTDVYILLAAVLIQLRIDHSTPFASRYHSVKNGLLLGLLIFGTLYIKETGLIFLPYTILKLFIKRSKNNIWAALSCIAMFSSLTVIAGLSYYFFTGDFFFRVHQIQTSFYPNPCNYSSFFSNEMFVRLTYGVWREFIIANYFPVLLATLAILLNVLFFKRIMYQKAYRYTSGFLILLLLGLYFPFSFSGYQPLCFKARHFLFLLPFAVVISTQFLEIGFARNKFGGAIEIIATILLLGICVKNSTGGYYWNFYRCFLLFFLFIFFVRVKWISSYSLSLFLFLLWFFLPYNYIFFRTSWFKNLRQLQTTLNGQYFYFDDHDNYSHWKLINHFDTSIHCFNIDADPFKGVHPYPYYEPLHFKPGWYISNKKHTVRSTVFLQKIDSLEKAHYFSKIYYTQNITAYYLSSSQQFYYLRNLAEIDRDSNCSTCNE